MDITNCVTKNTPQLFNVSTSPLENDDLVGRPGCLQTLRKMDAALRELVDPNHENNRCKANQASRA